MNISETIVASVLASLVSYFVARINLKFKYDKFNKDCEQYTEKIKNEKEEFEEQRRQFEINLQNQQLIKYKELITAERIKWVSILRGDITSYLGMMHKLIQKKVTFILNKKKDNLELGKFLLAIEDDYLKFITLSYTISNSLSIKDGVENSALNYNEFKTNIKMMDKNISQALTSENFDTNEINMINYKIGDFSNSCQKILNSEWKYAKNEAKAIYLDKNIGGK